jgi:hypothetical protein
MDSFDPLPLAWIDTDLAFPAMPKMMLRKPCRRRKSSNKKILRLPYQSLIPNNPSSPPIPNLKAKINPALVFGLQVSYFILRDTAMLQAESLSDSESPDTPFFQRKKALQHARLVTEQMSKRSNERCRLDWTGKGLKGRSGTFRFTDLPPEIRDMIYTFYFNQD